MLVYFAGPASHHIEREDGECVVVAGNQLLLVLPTPGRSETYQDVGT